MGQLIIQFRMQPGNGTKATKQLPYPTDSQAPADCYRHTNEDETSKEKQPEYLGRQPRPEK